MPLKPTIPEGKYLGPLKDLAQEVATASAALEGRVAMKTAMALGSQLRLINSYYSNLIEGHRTFIPDIQKALENNYSAESSKRYAQELCAAHVQAEEKLMAGLSGSGRVNVSSSGFIKEIHRIFYSKLPREHLFTHERRGFTGTPVTPGEFRDLEVAVHEGSKHGPDANRLPEEAAWFARDYDPANFHGDERLIAMAAAHHRLSWLHPFRDGNGRVCRLHSGLFMAEGGINRSNLWSLSRGLSRNKDEYMVNLFSVDPAPNDEPRALNERLADFCRFFLEICLDQVQFMSRQLSLEKIESRIEWYVERSQGGENKLPRESARLLRALFMEGRIPRGRAASILNVPETTYRRIRDKMQAQGLIVSSGPRQPLEIALPMKVMPFYFPNLYQPDILGDEYVQMLGGHLE